MEKSDMERANECVYVFPSRRCHPFLSVYSAEMNHISKIYLLFSFNICLLA